MTTRNLLVYQSGAPTAVVNTTLHGIVAEAVSAGFNRVIGSRYGVQGILNGDELDLTRWSSERREEFEMLYHTPGAFLGTTRYRVETEEEFDTIFRRLDEWGVNHIVPIGGNGTAGFTHRLYEAAKARGRELYIVVASKTMDNDIIGAYWTPGAPTAAWELATIVRMVALDAKSMSPRKEVAVIESLGRDSGWTAGAVSLLYEDDLRPLIYLPERPIAQQQVVEHTVRNLERDGYAVVVLSESLKDPTGELYAKRDSAVNGHGNGSVGSVFRRIFDEMGLKVREVVPGTLLRADVRYATLLDRQAAELVGRQAVRAVERGKTGIMIVPKNPDYGMHPNDILVQSSDGLLTYSIGTNVNPVGIIGSELRKFPDQWINEDSNSITEEGLAYYRLVVGRLGGYARLPELKSLSLALAATG
ncbi:MAG: 6-phosphofructokinase [Candidatus Aenigmarchaeota archaeon]|nr:6-phosphofructokinase [Candidatus Aenigmarchaeota archaeon]